MEAVEGASKTVAYVRTDVCGTCNGTRAKPGTSESSCGACGGSGMQTIRQGPIVMQTMCGACNGQGRVIRSPCLTCNGKGSQQKKVKETLKIPKGVNTGTNLRLSKKGHYSAGGSMGDLMIKVSVKPHTYFRRDNYDILSDCHISLGDAVLGGEVEVRTLKGGLNIRIDPGTQHNTKKKLVNAGINKLPPNQNMKGNHIITFKVQIPKVLSKEQKKAFEQYAAVEKPVKNVF